MQRLMTEIPEDSQTNAWDSYIPIIQVDDTYHVYMTKQIDNSYLTKYTNGLSTILDACTKHQDSVRLHAVTLPKVVRGKIAEFAETLFSKEAK